MTEAELLDTIRKALNLPNFNAGARMGGIRGWDSLRHVRLMLALEKASGETIPVDQFGTLTSVDAILAYFRADGRHAA